MALQQPKSQGHWQCDSIKNALTDQMRCPGLDAMILEAIKDCMWCKNFSAMHIHSLLNPITWCHPFKLLVGDYLSLLTGKGGYKTVGSGKTTISSLQQIFYNIATSETFMTDRGSHFNNVNVCKICKEWKCEHHVVFVY